MGSFDTLLIVFPILLFSVVLHEWAHARAAVAFGDDTPARMGRLTLNPLPHIDLVGSIVVPAALWLMPTSLIFGWAKPVPVNPGNYRQYRKGDIVVSLAGIASNLALAVVCLAGFVAASHLAAGTGGVAEGAEIFRQMFRWGIFFNLILAVFNLIPVPPLDGSHVLYHLLPPEMGARYRELGRYSLLLLLVVILFPGLLSVLLFPVFVLDGLAMHVAALLT